MKIDYSHSNVLGTPLRVLDDDATPNLEQLTREIEEFHRWHLKNYLREPTDQELTNAARAVVTSQIRRGLWAAWDIHEPMQMGHLLGEPSGLEIMRLKAFEPAELLVEEAEGKTVTSFDETHESQRS